MLGVYRKTIEEGKQKRLQAEIEKALVNGTMVPSHQEEKKSKKPRENLYLSPMADTILRFLSGKKSHSQYFEELLMEQYHALDEDTQQLIQTIHQR